MQQDELHKLLVSLFPGFQSQWDAPGNLHREGNSFTPHGLCAEFSSFYRAQKELSQEASANLFIAIEQVVSADPNDQDPVANALCTCFLENIAKTEAGEASIPFMGSVSATYFEFWHA